jgi:hypothetical protein
LSVLLKASARSGMTVPKMGAKLALQEARLTASTNQVKIVLELHQ